MTDDKLAADYLKRLRRAVRHLPRARRGELLDEIATHIAEARATGAMPLRRVLDELGDPVEIASVAGAGQRTDRLGWQETAAVVLLLGGGLVFLLGWLIGVVLLWTSPRWRWPDKLLGTLVWPGGYAGLLLYGLLAFGSGAGQVCQEDSSGKPAVCQATTDGGLPTWAVIVILVVAFVAPTAVAIRLVVTGRRIPGRAEPRIAEGVV